MLFYHIDKHHALHEDMILDKDENGLTSHGRVFWHNYQVDDRLIHWFGEHFFEQIRLKEYPQRPSRFESVFACTEEYISHWLRLINPVEGYDWPPWLWQVEAADYFVAEEGFLRSYFINDSTDQKILSPFWARENARKYWNGLQIKGKLDECDSLKSFQEVPDSPVEILLRPPVKVVRRISLKEDGITRG